MANFDHLFEGGDVRRLETTFALDFSGVAAKAQQGLWEALTLRKSTESL